MNNVPQIRFKGYTDAWEKRKLGDMSNTTFGGGTPNTSNENYWNGDIPWLQSSDIIEHDIFSINLRKHITNDGLRNSAAKLIPSDSIAVVTRVGVGKLSVIPFDYSTSQDFLSLSDLNVDIWYGAYALYRKLQKALHSVQGTSIKGITKDELLSKEVNTPSQKGEQAAIGKFFHTLDNTITLHKRKLENLKQLKKAYLQQLFPQGGESVPRVRFEGFSDAWQEMSLGDMLTERNEKIEESVDYPLMSFVGNVGVAPKGEQYDRGFLVKGDSKKYKKTKLNDFIYSSNNLETGSIGLNKTGSAVISPVYSIFHSRSSSVSQFVGLLASRREFINKMIHYRQGVMYGQWRIHEKDFLKIIVLSPSTQEQDEIVKFYDILDTKTFLDAQKLEQLQQLKNAYLQMMFI